MDGRIGDEGTAVNAHIALLGRLHEAQNTFYGGGEDTALRELLTPDISWHIPGRNAIAGDYQGIDDVIAYFARRRDLAGGTFRMHPRGILTGDGEWVAALTDGEAVIGGRTLTWSTVGLYRLRDGRIAACRLLPFDAETFDAVWTAQNDAIEVTTVSVRPRQCDAQGMVHASRYYEFFEDAFLDWLDGHVGGYAALRATGVDLVIVASGCDHHRPARLGDRLAIETRPTRVGDRSLSMSFTVRGPEGEVATGRTTYVAVSANGPVPLPESLRTAAGRA
jgi:YbgC/YbaW family acyl-CoA thioester hydrolase